MIQERERNTRRGQTFCARRWLALLLALFMALSSLGLAEVDESEPSTVDVEAIELPPEEVTLSLEEAELPPEAELPISDEADLELPPEALDDAEIELSPEEAVIQEQSAQLDGLRFILMGAPDPEAALTAEPVTDDAIVAASRDALGLGDEATHRLFHIALVDAAGEALPVEGTLRVEGLELSDLNFWVTVWDADTETCAVLDAAREDDAVSFACHGAGSTISSPIPPIHM